MSAKRGTRPASVCGAVAVLAVLAACGAPADHAVRSPTGTPPPVGTIDTSQVPEPDPVDALQPGTSTTSTTTTLPGDECLVFCPQPGDELSVVGIAFDQVLTLRSAPNPDAPVVGTLPPLTDVVATGDNRAAFFEVSAEGLTGWAPRGSLLELDGTTDIMPGIVDQLGAPPRAATMLELGKIVTDLVATCGSAPTPVVVAAAPTPGPVSEIVYDAFTVEECGGDSIAGQRIRVTGTQVTAPAELPPTGFARAVVFELTAAESTAICWRGSDGTLCV